ncbi:MAG: hypothetical protein ACFFCV_20865 [Promethearchaeota archaeon]
MPIKKYISRPIFSFILSEKLELKLKEYINSKNQQEIAGGLIGDIKGGEKNNIIFDIKKFLPFPNLSQDPKNFAIPPQSWFEILDDWRFFYHNEYKFLGFLHTHPESSSKLSKQDEQFGILLKKKYGSIVFIIIGKNKYLRCYCFNDYSIELIEGSLKYYRLIQK